MDIQDILASDVPIFYHLVHCTVLTGERHEIKEQKSVLKQTLIIFKC